MGKTLSRLFRNIFVIEGKRFDRFTKPDSYSSSVSYLIICLFLAFLLMSLSLFYFYYLIDGAEMGISLNYAVLDAGISVTSMLVTFLVFVAFIHVVARLFGARKNLQKTFQVHAYAYTPSFLLGWVYILGSNDSFSGMAFLFAGFLFSLLAVINGIIGLRRIHRLSFFKAVVAEFVVPLAAYMAFGVFMGMYGAKLGLV